MYTEERLKNWINRIKDAENDESLTIFDQMLEDVVITCLNIVRAFKEKEIRKDDAERELEKIIFIFKKDIKFESEVKNLAFQFTVESVEAVVRSFQYYLHGKVSNKSFEALLKEAIKKEKAGDLSGALDSIARMGAKVLNGEGLPELEVKSDGIILSWLDGIDCISTVLEVMKIDAPSEGDS